MNLLRLIAVPLLEPFHWLAWWYAPGLSWMSRWYWEELFEGERHTHWKQWAGSLFQPMYSTTDWQSRLISVCMRLVVLVYKTLWSALWILFHTVLFISYVLFPILSLTMIALTFMG